MASKRRLLVAAAVLAMAAPATVSARPVIDTPLSSANVNVIGHIPEKGAIGGQVRVVETLYGPRPYFVLTSARGVSVYDIVVPEAPVLVGHLPLPHFSNEDVSFGEDLLLVTMDPNWAFAGLYGQPEALGGVYLIDISRLPALSFAYVNPTTGNRWTAPAAFYAGHTISCVDARCDFAYVNGSNAVVIADLRNRAEPKVVRVFQSPVGSTHDIQVDDVGIVWMVGSGGIIGYDVSDPVNPIAVSNQYAALGYHHNSWRPRASEWTPRSDYATDPSVKPGELLLITEERFWPPPLDNQVLCDNQGRFATYWLRDTDPLAKGTVRASLQKLDEWKTEALVAGYSPAVLCSAHYFDEREGIVAISWYEQGTRFLDVTDPRNIRQVGYFIPPDAETFSVKWVGPGTVTGEVLYTIDVSRGIDILLFDRDANATVTAPILPQWLDTVGVSSPAAQPHPIWGFACRLVV